MANPFPLSNINFPGVSGPLRPAQTITTVSALGPTAIPINAMDVAVDNSANDVELVLPLAANGFRWVIWCLGVANDLILTPQATDTIGPAAAGASVTFTNATGIVVVSQNGATASQAILLIGNTNFGAL